MVGLLALVTASIFFGAAIYINIAEQPVRLGLDDGSALAQCRPADILTIEFAALMSSAAHLWEVEKQKWVSSEEKCQLTISPFIPTTSGRTTGLFS
jgi:hypothetical protein